MVLAMEDGAMETTIPAELIPDPADALVVRIREALRDHVACGGRRVAL